MPVASRPFSELVVSSTDVYSIILLNCRFTAACCVASFAVCATTVASCMVCVVITLSTYVFRQRCDLIVSSAGV